MLWNPTWQPDKAAQILLAAADYIEVHGWCQKSMKKSDGRVCALGAICSVSGMKILKIEQRFSSVEPNYPTFYGKFVRKTKGYVLSATAAASGYEYDHPAISAATRLAQYLFDSDSAPPIPENRAIWYNPIPIWNDRDCTTKEDAVKALRAAAFHGVEVKAEV